MIIQTRCSLLLAPYSQKYTLCAPGRSMVRVEQWLFLRISTIGLFFGGCWWPSSRFSSLVSYVSWFGPLRYPPKGQSHSICNLMHRLILLLMPFLASPPGWLPRRYCDPLFWAIWSWPSQLVGSGALGRWIVDVLALSSDMSLSVGFCRRRATRHWKNIDRVWTWILLFPHFSNYCIILFFLSSCCRLRFWWTPSASAGSTNISLKTFLPDDQL